MFSIKIKFKKVLVEILFIIFVRARAKIKTFVK